MRTPTTRRRPWLTGTLLLCAAAWLAAPAQARPTSAASPAQSSGNRLDDTLLQAREAWRRGDAARLASARDTLMAAGHPLAAWADYWALNQRLRDAQQAELDAFYARWPGGFLEDKLRSDWLLELGKRRDWAGVRAEFPRFRMNDDREVTCYWLLAQHEAGEPVREQALQAWRAQRDGDEACPLLGRTLVAAGVFKPEDIWQTLRIAVEFNRQRTATATAALISPATGNSVAELLRDPSRYLTRSASVASQRELALLALMRVAAGDPDAAARALEERWQRELNPTLAATAWALVARHAAQRLNGNAAEWAGRAWTLRGQSERTGHTLAWTDEALAWHVRAGLRQPAGEAGRWELIARATSAMSEDEQRNPAWLYWRARALQDMAPPGPAGDEARAAARETLQGLARQTGFYPKLATEDLGLRLALPPAPAALSAQERRAAQQHPGLSRGLALLALGLRSEGNREWNFSLRGMGERELLAAAQRACDAQVWDRCINTSERTREEVDMRQRFPMPHRAALARTAREVGLEPALMYGLIRQESRFITDARSHVGASGLMQLMPATAQWTAKRIGMNYSRSMINDPDVNLRLGASYLRIVLDDFQGSQALATAAYNAGPGRPRRWREGPEMDPAAWAETIPFAETRDYVQKVLSNATYYALLMDDARPEAVSLRARLGPPVGPRARTAPPADARLP